MITGFSVPLIIASVTAGGSGQPYPLLIDGYALPVTVRSFSGPTGEGGPRDRYLTCEPLP
jgi:hypothetical protein